MDDGRRLSVRQAGPSVIAHRGAASTCPENTLTAIRAALAAGVEGVEVDVQMSACGTPMVIHDATLDRTTDHVGPVNGMTAAELSRVSAHEARRWQDRFLGEPLPTLAAVATLIAAAPQVRLFVDVKPECLTRNAAPAVTRRIAADTACLGERRVIISGVDALIQTARSLHGLTVGWVLPALDPGVLERARVLRPAFLFCDQALILPGKGPLPSGSWEWAIYEITRADDARKYHARGAGWVETMCPAELRQALGMPAGR